MAGVQDWVDVTCPQCGTAQALHVRQSVDLAGEPEAVESLFAGQLNVFACVKCRSALHYDEYLLASDRERGLLISVFPAASRERLDEICSRMFAELSRVPPQDLRPGVILFGYDALSAILSLMARAEKGKGPDFYRGLFLQCEEGLLLRRESGYLDKLRAAEAPFREAVELTRSGNVTGAAEAYRRILADAPAHMAANFNLGLLCANELADPMAAAGHFMRCRAFRPNDPELVFVLGQALLQAKEVDRAVACFKNAVILAPQNVLSWFNLGLGLSMTDKREEGIRALEASLGLAASEEDKELISRTLRKVEDNP